MREEGEEAKSPGTERRRDVRQSLDWSSCDAPHFMRKMGFLCVAMLRGLPLINFRNYRVHSDFPEIVF